MDKRASISGLYGYAEPFAIRGIDGDGLAETEAAAAAGAAACTSGTGPSAEPSRRTGDCRILITQARARGTEHGQNCECLRLTVDMLAGLMNPKA
jgi:hypothetical protein